mgnify:CR=1 FL=1
MLFNSKDYLLFLPIVFALYWLAGSRQLRIQNAILLFSSYFFYAFWEPKFLAVLLFSTGLNYGLGIRIANTSAYRIHWFVLGLLANIGCLCFFKYNDFFVESFQLLNSNLGLSVNLLVLKILLPVGISFYTFHGLSYLIDIYKGKTQVERNLVDFSLFISFFPLLVAGPIERATHLLPQIKKPRHFRYDVAVDGLRQILWGLFKKIVIADNCALYADLIFDHHENYSGSTLLVGVVFFAFQIYGDFSGYSDIALGTAKLFGISLLQNFAFPYFSRDIAEFWRRWHISLTTWFRDYLYIPLGGNKGSTWHRIRNTLIVFIVSGMWHGSSWTFVVWGVLNALFFIPLVLTKKNRVNLDIVAKGKMLPSLRELGAMALTFTITLLCWVFFRAENLDHAFSYLSKIFSESFWSVPQIKPVWLTLLVFLFLVIEWMGRENTYALEKFGFTWRRVARLTLYVLLILAIFWYSSDNHNFIYFQF